MFKYENLNKGRTNLWLLVWIGTPGVLVELVAHLRPLSDRFLRVPLG